jgi:hypothetical protein
MRIPRFLSYSGFALYEKDREEFFTRYLADRRPARVPQERPAAAGSAFDAYVKSALHSSLFGSGADPQFEFDAIFTSQVEEHNRDWARVAGHNIFEQYVYAGGYQDLLGLLQKAVGTPRFEFTVEGLLNETVPFLGKPDLRFIWNGGEGPVHIVHDFKVNGYCSNSATSPSKHYMLCRDGWQAGRAKPTRGGGREHPCFVKHSINGLTIDRGWMEHANDEWADQLSIYGWLLGEEPGDENVVLSIDQLVAKPADPPLMRVAQFRARVSGRRQIDLLGRITLAWKAISTGHIFTELSREANDERCRQLEEQCVSLASDGSVHENFFNECVRPAYRG